MRDNTEESRLRRWVNLGAMLLALPFVMLVPGDAPGSGQHAAILTAASHDRFNIAVWEAVHVFDLLPQVVPEEGADVVERYFEFAADLRRAAVDVNQRLALSGGDALNVSEALTERDHIRGEMEGIEGATKHYLREAVGDVLQAEGFVLDLPLIEPFVFPPLAFTLEQLPWALVVSPRDRIELMEVIQIRPDITEAEMERLEESLRHKGLSATTEPLGGLSTYPTLVKSDADLRFTLATIGHEWVHHYLFFKPLGQRHGRSGEMTTINETAANIVGSEIAALILGETPPLLRPQQTEQVSVGDPASEVTFDVNGFLRETRLTAERMLEEGRLDEAESYMEQRRIEIAGHGVYIRNLNQAYFAFYGSYADRPGAVSPIFAQLVAVRQAEPSIGAFLRRIAGVRTPEELTALAEAAGTN